MLVPTELSTALSGPTEIAPGIAAEVHQHSIAPLPYAMLVVGCIGSIAALGFFGLSFVIQRSFALPLAVIAAGSSLLLVIVGIWLGLSSKSRAIHSPLQNCVRFLPKPLIGMQPIRRYGRSLRSTWLIFRSP